MRQSGVVDSGRNLARPVNIKLDLDWCFDINFYHKLLRLGYGGALDAIQFNSGTQTRQIHIQRQLKTLQKRRLSMDDCIAKVAVLNDALASSHILDKRSRNQRWLWLLSWSDRMPSMYRS